MRSGIKQSSGTLERCLFLRMRRAMFQMDLTKVRGMSPSAYMYLST
jgi:hypothetical protein